MSDFDKEAEREKLRKRFEEEDEQRQATEQMSELLLKGATMTNAHCSACGDPIFRYDGQEFCPTCQKPITREQSADDAETEADDGDGIEVADPSDEARVQFGGQDESTASEQSDGSAPADTADAPASGQSSPSTDSQPSRGEAANARSPGADAASAPQQSPPETEENDLSRASENAAMATESPDDRAASRSSTAARRSPPSQSTPSVSSGTERQQTVADDLAEANALLAQTVRRYAELARDAESPRESREYLQAAREAAEALEAASF